MSDTTIILVTHDRPAWFDQAKASADAQGCEVIVVDDSTRLDYARTVHRQMGMGYARARLTGLHYVTTPYFAFLDDDDVLMPDWLERSRVTMDEGYDVVAASYIETDAKLKRLRTHSLQPATLGGLLSGYNPVNDTALVRRSVLQGVTWHPERDTAMMFSLWIDLAARGARFGVVPDAWLWKRRLHGDNMSGRLDETHRARIAAAIAEHAA